MPACLVGRGGRRCKILKISSRIVSDHAHNPIQSFGVANLQLSGCVAKNKRDYAIQIQNSLNLALQICISQFATANDLLFVNVWASGQNNDSDKIRRHFCHSHVSCRLKGKQANCLLINVVQCPSSFWFVTLCFVICGVGHRASNFGSDKLSLAALCKYLFWMNVLIRSNLGLILMSLCAEYATSIYRILNVAWVPSLWLCWDG